MNTNGKVEGMGITFPNALGQERVIRHAYKRANLDPNDTAYLECHVSDVNEQNCPIEWIHGLKTLFWEEALLKGFFIDSFLH